MHGLQAIFSTAFPKRTVLPTTALSAWKRLLLLCLNLTQWSVVL